MGGQEGQRIRAKAHQSLRVVIQSKKVKRVLQQWMELACAQWRADSSIPDCRKPEILAEISHQVCRETIAGVLWAQPAKSPNGRRVADLGLRLNGVNCVVGDAVAKQQVAVDA